MIIGIESSCDESAVAVFDPSQGVLLDLVSSQVKLHAKYGGVVPNLASREHVKNFVHLFEELKKFGVANAKSIAVTAEPGLPGCLNIGIAAARALGTILNLPILNINHLHGHLFSPFIKMHENDPKEFKKIFKNFLPALGLLVSGGNTILVEIQQNLKMEIVAETLDDAAGEAFDKGARLLGLPYPGGMLIEKFAKSGNPHKYNFPRAFHDTPEMKFSFSGLKTSLRYFLEKENIDLVKDIPDICASYQEAIIDALCLKLEQALTKKPHIRCVCLCGGVSNNENLQNRALEIADRHRLDFFAPLKQHTGDNAAMIAFAEYILNDQN